MRIGLIGLGKMGANMVRRLLQAEHEVVVYDISPDPIKALETEGAIGAYTLEEVVEKLSGPRHIWVMVPSGEATEETINSLAKLCNKKDLIIDGGNSNFRDSKRRGKALAEQGIHFCDVGVSGGVWGLKIGYCMMAGGAAEDIASIKPILDSLAPEKGWDHFGPVGAGHFVKMVHNGIEYSMLQAYGEGFEIMRASEYKVDLHKASAVWNRGSVVRSWLLELAESAFERHPDLTHVKDYVVDSGEGRWTVLEAINEDVPAPTIALSLFQRFASRQDESFSNKVVAALRHEFGGHAVKSEGD